MRQLASIHTILQVVVILSPVLCGCETGPSAGTGSGPARVSGDTLYERLGGRKAIEVLIDDFLTRSATDPAISFDRSQPPPRSTPAKAERHPRKRLVDFICAAAGGPRPYTGHSMRSIHHGMKISDAEFDVFLANFDASMDHCKVPPKEREELRALITGVRREIVE